MAAEVEGADWRSGRPRRSGTARREQARRAEGRAVQRLFKNLEMLGNHRGCQRSKVGEAIFAALQAALGADKVPLQVVPHAVEVGPEAAPDAEGEHGDPAEGPPHDEDEEAVSDGVSGPGPCLQGTGVVAVGRTPAATSTQSAGVVTTPAAPPAKQELAVQRTAAGESPAPALAEYQVVRSTSLVGRRYSAGQRKAATQVSPPRPVRVRVVRVRIVAATRSEIAMARKCIYAYRANFGELRELIAELRKLVFTDEVPVTLLGNAWGAPRTPGREDAHELRGRSRRVRSAARVAIATRAYRDAKEARLYRMAWASWWSTGGLRPAARAFRGAKEARFTGEVLGET
jgi:hypothetical protein